MRQVTSMPLIGRLVALLVAVIILMSMTTAAILGTLNRGPAQPIPFSHHVHAQNKQINCIFCHQYAFVSSNAGIPSVEKCLLCHGRVVSEWRPVNMILQYNARGEGIPWVRINRLPDHVHFSHQAHTSARHDCSECHGNIRGMDRVRTVHNMNMNFCVTCHWKNKVSVNCYICHY